MHPHDIRLVIRRLAKAPGVTMASVAALACALGAGAATWSLLHAVLINPLPVDAPDRLMVVGHHRVEAGISYNSYSDLYPFYLTIRESGVFARVAVGGQRSLLVADAPGGPPRERLIHFGSHDFFAVLGIRAALGSGFVAADDQRGAPIRAVLSDSYWSSAFGRDPDVVGRTISIAGHLVEVAGVAPRGFRGLNLASAPDLYLPLHTVGDVDERGNFFAEPLSAGRGSPVAWLTVIGRLKPTETATLATERLAALAPELARGGEIFLIDVNTAAIPDAARAGMRQFTRLLSITVGLLMLIGAFTVATLLLVRTEARRRELAVCLALGASRTRLMTAIAAEGTLLALAGALFAIPMATLLLAGVRAFQLPGGVDIALLALSLDRQIVMAVACGAAAATVLITATAGGIGLAATSSDTLRPHAATRPDSRTRMMLVVAQTAVALVLLAGAGLFARSVIAALGVNPGFETRHIVSTTIGLRPYGYSPERGRAFFEELHLRLRESHAIRSVSMIQRLGGMTPFGTLAIDGERRQFPTLVGYVAVDEHYFSTVGLPILEGRGFSSSDTAASRRVVVVSQSLGRLLADGGSPIGRGITDDPPPAGDPRWADMPEIIGVVPDVITNIGVMEPLVQYFFHRQEPRLSSPLTREVVIRAADVRAAKTHVLDAVRQLDATITPAPPRTMDERLAEQMSAQRLGIRVMGTLGGIAILLTMLGAYLVAETMAVTRRREMGIRAALGATRMQLSALVLGNTGRLVGAGLAAGLALAWGGASTIESLLFGVEPLDALTLGAVAGGILTLSLLVTLRPAIEAGRVDPARTLREE